MTPFNSLIVEGTSGVGKSTLIDALLRRHAMVAEPRRLRSTVHLAQSHTYGPLAWGEDHGTLTVAENQRHLERIVGILEWLHLSVQQHSKPWCFSVLDTLHLTHCVRPGAVEWPDVAIFDRRLAALGCKLIFLRAKAETIWERGITPRINQEFILEYAKKFGTNLEQIHQYFVQEQERLVDLYKQSTMQKMFLESDVLDAGHVETAYRFWHDDGSRAASVS
jgi:hypothetical protein